MSLKKLIAAFVVVLSMVVAAPKTASAATIIGFSCVNCGGGAGQGPLFMGTVTVSGAQMLVDIKNNGSLGTAGQIYADFPDLNLATKFAFASVINAPGTAFDDTAPFTANPDNLPASDGANPDFDTDFRTGPANNPPGNGLNNGETVRLIFNLLAGQSQGDIDTLLGNGGIRFGLHVISIPGSDSQALVSNPPGEINENCVNGTCATTPEPASMLLLGTGLLAVARARRKKTV